MPQILCEVTDLRYEIDVPVTAIRSKTGDLRRRRWQRRQQQRKLLLRGVSCRVCAGELVAVIVSFVFFCRMLVFLIKAAGTVIAIYECYIAYISTSRDQEHTHRAVNILWGKSNPGSWRRKTLTAQHYPALLSTSIERRQIWKISFQ